MRARVLFVDDSDTDVELLLRRLRSDSVEVEWTRVSTMDDLREALTGATWDVALVDYNLPGFSGLEAMGMIADAAPDTPMITVSGAIDEETAVATLTAGAVDYVLKDNPARLAPAVERAIAGARARRDLRRRSEDARTSQFVLDNSSFPITMALEDGTTTYANQSALALTGYPESELVGAKLWECDRNQSAEEWAALWRRVRDEGTVQTERVSVDAGEAEHVLEITMNHLEREGTPVVVTYTRDVTETRRAEAALRASEERFEAFGRHLPGYLYMLDEDGRYVFANQRELHEGDIPPESWIGRTPEELWPEEDATVATDAFRRALAGEVVDILETWHPGPRVEHLHSLFFPIPREGGPPLVGGLSLDVGELVAAEEEVRRTAGQLRQSTEHLRQSLEGTVLAMSQIVETRDPYTAGHQRRVAELALAIAGELGLEGEDLEGIRIAATIHDIGKIAVPAEILTKPGRLSEAEFSLIQQHSQAGHDILAGIRFERPVAEIILQHHERLDGSGYPNGLAGAAIMREARILSVADVVEAMSSHRPYRASRGTDAALAEIEEGAGRLYDADVVAACLVVLRERGFAFSD